MLTNDELKKKIMDILQLKLQECPLQPHGIMYKDAAEYIADALITAGYGDVKDLQTQVDALEITNIALQAGYDGAEKDRLYWVNKYKEAEHRAEVAERALLNLCVDIQPYSLFDQTPLVTEASAKMQKYLQQAEKELMEEEK